MDLSSLREPTLLLDEKQCRQNIKRMHDKARNHRVDLIPHFKTHQSREIGRWFNESGTDRITVSSLQMARYFSDAGWNGITLAFPVNPRVISDIDLLAAEVDLTLFINSEAVAQFVEEKLTRGVGVFTEIDTGYRRSGIPAENIDEIHSLIQRFRRSEQLNFRGFYVHNGATYQARNKKQIAEQHGIMLHHLNQLRKAFSNAVPELELGIGDTPACRSVDNFAGINSIHPGNYVFYDINQCHIGTCTPQDIAVALACPVVSRRPERNEVVLHGGAIHLSEDFEQFEDGTIHYGRPVSLYETVWGEIWEDAYVRSLSQEHGILKCNKKQFDEISVGDMIGILPVHSCLTANLMGEYLTLDGQKIDHFNSRTS